MRDHTQDRGHRPAPRLHWLGLAFMAALLTACDDVTPPRTVDIARVLDSQWKARNAGLPGGLTAVLITPTGE